MAIEILVGAWALAMTQTNQVEQPYTAPSTYLVADNHGEGDDALSKMRKEHEAERQKMNARHKKEREALRDKHMKQMDKTCAKAKGDAVEKCEKMKERRQKMMEKHMERSEKKKDKMEKRKEKMDKRKDHMKNHKEDSHGIV